MSADPDLSLLADAHLSGNTEAHKTRLLGEIVAGNRAAAEEFAELALAEALLHRPRMDEAKLNRLLDRRAPRPAAPDQRARRLWMISGAAAALIVAMIVWKLTRPEPEPEAAVKDSHRPRVVRHPVVLPLRAPERETPQQQPADKALLFALQTFYLPVYQTTNAGPAEVCQDVLTKAAGFGMVSQPELEVADSPHRVTLSLTSQSAWTLFRVAAAQCDAEPFLDGQTLRFRSREWREPAASQFSVASLREVLPGFLSDMDALDPAPVEHRLATLEKSAVTLLAKAFGPLQRPVSVSLTKDQPEPALSLAARWSRQVSICLEGSNSAPKWCLMCNVVEIPRESGEALSGTSLAPEAAANLLTQSAAQAAAKKKRYSGWLDTNLPNPDGTVGPMDDWAGPKLTAKPALQGDDLAADVDFVWHSEDGNDQIGHASVLLNGTQMMLLHGPETENGRLALLLRGMKRGGAGPPPPESPPADPDNTIPSGILVKDRPGFVQSPHSPGEGRLVDVTGLKPGEKVKCPYTGKMFLVPASGDQTPTAPPPDKPASAPADDLPVAQAAPGKQGFVYSPYAPDKGLVDVEGLKPGTRVMCPYTRKPFRIP